MSELIEIVQSRRDPRIYFHEGIRPSPAGSSQEIQYPISIRVCVTTLSRMERFSAL